MEKVRAVVGFPLASERALSPSSVGGNLFFPLAIGEAKAKSLRIKKITIHAPSFQIYNVLQITDHLYL